MEILAYTLTLLISFLGLAAGIIICNMTIEEIYHASKYLKYLNIILIPVILLVAVYNINKLYAIIFSCITLIILVIFREKYNNSWIYSCMVDMYNIAPIQE